MSLLLKRRWLAGLFVAAGLSLTGPDRPAVAQPTGPQDQDGVAVLNRGPIHEAFASAVTYDPRPCPIVEKQPPAPIDEQPPDEKPDGPNVQWIPGYWFWEDSRTDFIWVSGIWREPPPDCQWTPGYWSQCDQSDGRWQWTCGCWRPVDQEQCQYLPTPPPSVETGPNCPPPAENANCTWAPGYWKWCLECEAAKYVWCPGSWVEHRPDWVWTPPRYVPTPCGCLFVKGYWDYPLERRGVMYAPVYYTQPCYTRPDYVYRPSVCIPPTTLTSCLFVKPACQCYCFGDYFDRSCSKTGTYPWYAYHNSRYGCDPIYSYCAGEHRGDPQWSRRVHEEYSFRRDNTQSRPPWLCKDQHEYLNRPAGKFNQLALGDSIHNLAARNALPQRLVKVSAEHRQAMAEQGRHLHTASQRRLTQEAGAARNPGRLGEQPLHVSLPWSPIASRTQRSGHVNDGVGRNPGAIGPRQGGSMPPNHPRGLAGNTGVIGPLQGGSLPPNHPRGVGRNPGAIGPRQGGSMPTIHRGGRTGTPNGPVSTHPSAVVTRHQPPAHPIDPHLDHSMRSPGSGYVPNRPVPDHNLLPYEQRGTGHLGSNSFGRVQGSGQPFGPARTGSSHGRSVPTRSNGGATNPGRP